MKELIKFQTYQELIQHERSLPEPQTYEELIATDSRQFIYVENVFGKHCIVDTINDTLVEICKHMSFEVSGDMTSKAAELIADMYKLSKIADLKMFERFMLSGKAGTLYRMDTPTILAAYEKYYAEMADVDAAHREQKHAERKKEIDESEMPSDERIRELINTARLKSVGEFEEKKQKKAIKNMSVEEICNRNGVSYNDLLRGNRMQWRLVYDEKLSDSGIEFETFARQQQHALDIRIKEGKEFVIVDGK